jgi:hypothetical protein
MRSRFLAAALTVAASVSLAGDRVTLTGKVTDTLGNPLEDATVMIYHAGVKRGYSTYCPSCYADCGKRAVTNRGGSFTFKSVDPNLWFELLVVRNGYMAAFVERVDPARGSATAALVPRAAVDDAARVVRGRVVDTHGRPLRDVVVLPQGVETVSAGCIYFTTNGLEPVAVTNAKGEFELAYKEKAKGIMLRVEARGMATRFIAVPTGAEPKTITVSEGAVIRGRLVHRGKPVAGAEIGLIAQDTGAFGMHLKITGNPYPEVRIGTLADGSFVIPNVPVPIEWYLYGTMESTAAQGATERQKCATRRDSEIVDVGDVQILQGHRFRGKVTLSDGASMADGMRVTMCFGDLRGDSQTAPIDSQGRFEFTGGTYAIFSSVKGYRMRANPRAIETTIDRDIGDFEIMLDPVVRQ